MPGGKDKKSLHRNTEQGKESHLEDREEQHGSENAPFLDLEKMSRKLFGTISRLVSVIQLQKNRLK